MHIFRLLMDFRGFIEEKSVKMRRKEIVTKIANFRQSRGQRIATFVNQSGKTCQEGKKCYEYRQFVAKKCIISLHNC